MNDLSSVRIHINKNIVSVQGLIQFQFQLDSRFRYIGRLDIMLDDITRAEIDIFLDPDEKTNDANRYFLVQNEYRPVSSQKSYHYKHDNFIELWGLSWQIDNSIWHGDLNDTNSDSTQVHLFALNKGFNFPEYMMNNKLMHLYGKNKHGELLLIYGENALTQPVGWKEIIKNNAIDKQIWNKEIPNLQARAFSAMHMQK